MAVSPPVSVPDVPPILVNGTTVMPGDMVRVHGERGDFLYYHQDDGAVERPTVTLWGGLPGRHMWRSVYLDRIEVPSKAMAKAMGIRYRSPPKKKRRI